MTSISAEFVVRSAVQTLQHAYDESATQGVLTHVEAAKAELMSLGVRVARWDTSHATIEIESPKEALDPSLSGLKMNWATISFIRNCLQASGREDIALTTRDLSLLVDGDDTKRFPPGKASMMLNDVVIFPDGYPSIVCKNKESGIQGEILPVIRLGGPRFAYAEPSGSDNSWTADFGYFFSQDPGLDLLKTQALERLRNFYDKMADETYRHSLFPTCLAQTEEGDFAEAAVTFAKMCVDSCRAVATECSTQEWDCGLLGLPEGGFKIQPTSVPYWTHLLAVYRQAGQTPGTATNDGIALENASGDQTNPVAEPEPDRLTSGFVRRSILGSRASQKKEAGSFCSGM